MKETKDSFNEEKLGDCTDRLDSTQLSCLLSHYLYEGYRSEAAVVEQLEVQGEKASARCRVSEAIISPYDQQFHLSAVNGFVFVQQVGIAHAHLLHGRREKAGEAIISRLTFEGKRMIRNSEDILLKMEVFAIKVEPPRGRRRHPRTYISWTYDLQEGAWFGTLDAVFPFT